MCPYYLELTHLCSNELLYTSRRNQESFNVNKKHRHKDIKRDNWHILFFLNKQGLTIEREKER